MAVLMTYHKLVERDSKNVDVHWKAASIVLLVIAIVSSLTVSMSLQKLSSAFDDRCVLGAHLEFETELEKRVNYYKEKLTEIESSTFIASTKSHVPLSDVFNTSYAEFLGEYSEEFPFDQVKYLHEKQINDRTSVWGDKSRCDFGVYTPICQCCFAIIVMTMFVICGKGGKGDENSYLSEPWRIVTPALIFFIIMTIFSLSNLVVIESGITKLCTSFNEGLPDIGCNIALNRYMTASLDTIRPGVTRVILTTFNYISFFVWLASALLLVARIVFVVDFQLVRVTVKSMEYENAKESSNFKVIEEHEEPIESDSKSSPIIYKQLREETNQEIDANHSTDSKRKK